MSKSKPTKETRSRVKRTDPKKKQNDPEGMIFAATYVISEILCLVVIYTNRRFTHAFWDRLRSINTLATSPKFKSSISHGKEKIFRL